MAFQPGQSGNPGGRPKEKMWRDALMRAVKRKLEGDTLALEMLADAIVAAGISGDVSAAREIGDRLDGKVPQALVNDEDGAPFVINVMRYAAEEKP